MACSVRPTGCTTASAWRGRARGVPVLRVSYRRPGDLEGCCLDVAATVQLAVGAGAERVVVMGHSFGGAVAVRVGVGLEPLVAGVVTFATQSAGCEIAGGLQGKPLLLFHGERDEILPIEASEMVRMLAGGGELVRLPGDGHLLAKSGDILWERLEEWLPDEVRLTRVGGELGRRSADDEVRLAGDEALEDEGQVVGVQRDAAGRRLGVAGGVVGVPVEEDGRRQRRLAGLVPERFGPMLASISAAAE